MRDHAVSGQQILDCHGATIGFHQRSPAKGAKGIFEKRQGRRDLTCFHDVAVVQQAGDLIAAQLRTGGCAQGRGIL